MTWMNHVCLLLMLVFSPFLAAGQLFMSQDSVNLRSIHSWDHNQEIHLEGVPMASTVRTNIRSTFSFDFEDTCGGASYEDKRQIKSMRNYLIV